MKKDLNIITGYTFEQPFHIVAIDQNDVEYDYDLADKTVIASAKPSASSCKTYIFTVNVTSEAEGKFVLRMPSDVTETITESTLVYDIKILDDLIPGNAWRCAYGNITVEKEITITP